MSRADSRTQHTTLTAKVRRDDDGTLLVLAPCVGRFREGPGVGSRVQPGQVLGVLEVLGKRLVVHAPHDARGTVIKDDAAAVCQPTRRAPVSFGDVLCRLDPRAGVDAAEAETAQAAAGNSAGDLVFKAPTSGRFYARPSPDQPAFVSGGDVLKPGATVGLLEVMKTFNRITYGGAGLPETATVIRVVPSDGDDVEAGDPLLELA
jgi:acetyl-CoA carboxylase biotin carboxyl carrier protein